MTASEKTMQNYDRYISQLFAPEDAVLQSVREAMRREGLPQINVSASGGQLLYMPALMNGARRILEIGTLGGYSAIWLARALPADGKLISLEVNEHHANVARRNLAEAGLAAKVEVRVGPALETLAQMEQAGEAAFDLVFIDADKDGYVAVLGESRGAGTRRWFDPGRQYAPRCRAGRGCRQRDQALQRGCRHAPGAHLQYRACDAQPRP